MTRKQLKGLSNAEQELYCLFLKEYERIKDVTESTGAKLDERTFHISPWGGNNVHLEEDLELLWANIEMLEESIYMTLDLSDEAEFEWVGINLFKIKNFINAYV